jgi:hypothetical protein
MLLHFFKLFFIVDPWLYDDHKSIFLTLQTSLHQMLVDDIYYQTKDVLHFCNLYNLLDQCSFLVHINTTIEVYDATPCASHVTSP